MAAQTGGDLLAWTSGPLPDQALEAIALTVFQRQYPTAAWTDPIFATECNDARRFALKLRIEFLKLDRWTLGNMDAQLEAGFTRIVCGDRGPFPAERAQLRQYAASCLQGLFARFSGDRNPLVLPDADAHTWMIPHGHGISDQWKQSFVATKFAEVLTALTCGVPFMTLDASDRSWLRQHTEHLVESAVARFQRPVQSDDCGRVASRAGEQ